MSVVASATELLLVLVVLTDFAILGSSRLSASIRIVAAQGLLLGALPLLLHGGVPAAHTAAFALTAAGVKGVLIPWLLGRAMREAAVRREVEPFIGFTASLVIGGLLTAAAFALARDLPVPVPPAAPLLVPVALTTFMIGALVMVSRKKAVTQVLGYLLLENGIFLLGQTLASRLPTLVEMGILLDVLVGVFVMGIAIFHINREFDHMSVPELASLRD